MKKILICDSMDKEALKVLEDDPMFQVDYKAKEQDLKDIVKDYHAIVVRSGTKVEDKAIFENASNLELIIRGGVGYDNVDTEEAAKNNIIVENAPGGSTVTTAEHAMAIMLAMARNIPQANISLRNKGFWERKKFQGVELYDKVLGVIGYGRIGREVAKRAKAFGMKILVDDPYVSEEQLKGTECRKAELSELLQQSDFITLHPPLTDETTNLLNDKTLSEVKPGVRIVNCARGEMIDEEALLNALDSGRVAGAALDVYSEESKLKEGLTETVRKLANHPNVVALPHLGASTDEGQKKVAQEVVQQLQLYFKTGELRNAVNYYKLNEKIQPYKPLVEYLGKLAGQITSGAIKEVRMTCFGDVFQKNNISGLTNIALKGLLERSVGDVTHMNSSVIAKERGIKVDSTSSQSDVGYVEPIRLEVVTDKENRKVYGALIKGEPRITGIDDFEMEFRLGGYHLLLGHTDHPGVIGYIGSILGENKINIANMVLGREYEGGPALAVFTVDSEVPQETLGKIRQLRNRGEQNLPVADYLMQVKL